ncbi:hypothetical protein [Microtetraspora glauca]|uniref:Uncharacterized protein n=1 Tax=Microtetraspora glauca TaxID=1996 RepID=A0ABV3GTC6_MICGL
MKQVDVGYRHEPCGHVVVFREPHPENPSREPTPPGTVVDVQSGPGVWICPCSERIARAVTITSAELEDLRSSGTLEAQFD